MSRYIDADALIESIKNTADLGGWIGETLYQIKQVAVKYIDSAPSIDILQWIPCSERLPEENVAVLTQAKFKDDIKMAVSARQDYNYWTGWGTREVNIVAWMPLPKPYGERKEEQ